MQRGTYEALSSCWSLTNKDPVVGSFDYHNNWQDYDDYLFKDIDTSEKKALDFACGPGRNMVKFWNKFKVIDGTDFILTNLNNAKTWMSHNGIDYSNIKLILGNGWNLETINDKEYDIVYSTIALQHICVWELRHNYFVEFHRVLKDDGWICIQMGFGPQVPSKFSVDYYDNFYYAGATNGAIDVRIESVDQIHNELTNIGYKDFRYWIRPVGPGDGHPNWIFFQARK